MGAVTKRNLEQEVGAGPWSTVHGPYCCRHAHAHTHTLPVRVQICRQRSWGGAKRKPGEKCHHHSDRTPPRTASQVSRRPLSREVVVCAENSGAFRQLPVADCVTLGTSLNLLGLRCLCCKWVAWRLRRGGDVRIVLSARAWCPGQARLSLEQNEGNWWSRSPRRAKKGRGLL